MGMTNAQIGAFILKAQDEKKDQRAAAGTSSRVTVEICSYIGGGGKLLCIKLYRKGVTHAFSFFVTKQETNLQERPQRPPAPHASPNAIPDPAPKAKPRAMPHERMDPVRQKQAVAPRDAEMTIHDKTTSSLTVMNDLRSRFPVSWVEL